MTDLLTAVGNWSQGGPLNDMEGLAKDGGKIYSGILLYILLSFQSWNNGEHG